MIPSKRTTQLPQVALPQTAVTRMKRSAFDVLSAGVSQQHPISGGSNESQPSSSDLSRFEPEPGRRHGFRSTGTHDST